MPARTAALLILVPLAILACHSGTAQENKQPDARPIKLEGRYACAGTNLGGIRYRGTVRISKQGDAYLATWTLEAGDSYGGIGLLTGDVFSVAWDAGGAPGIVAYKVENRNDKLRLIGRWTAPGMEGKVLEETLTPML